MGVCVGGGAVVAGRVWEGWWVAFILFLVAVGFGVSVAINKCYKQVFLCSIYYLIKTLVVMNHVSYFCTILLIVKYYAIIIVH